MSLRFSVLALVAAVPLAACTMAPRVVALPGTGKTFEQFTADDTACRTWASQRQGSSSQWQYDMAYTQCMYSRGHRVPISGGQYVSPGSMPASALPADAPPPPAGTPPPPPPGPSR